MCDICNIVLGALVSSDCIDKWQMETMSHSPCHDQIIKVSKQTNDDYLVT